MTTQNAQLRERSGTVDSKDPLVSFLYILMRDHLPAGVVEGIVQKHVVYEVGKFPPTSSDSEFCNGYLAKYAEDLATRLQTACPSKKPLVGVNEILNTPMSEELRLRIEAYARELRDVPLEVLELACFYVYSRYAAAIGPQLRRVAAFKGLDGNQFCTMGLPGNPAIQVFGLEEHADFCVSLTRQADESLMDLSKRVPKEAIEAFEAYLADKAKA